MKTTEKIIEALELRIKSVEELLELIENNADKKFTNQYWENYARHDELTALLKWIRGK